MNSQLASIAFCLTKLFVDELDANRLKPEPTDSMTEKSQSSSSRSAIEVPEPESVTYIEHEDPFSTVEGASGSPHVTTLSQHAWVACGNDTYILDCLGQGFIKVQIGTDPGQPSYCSQSITPNFPDKILLYSDL